MRAQVTLFVIIAILIVSSAGAIYYISSTASKSVLARETAIINSVPEKFRPAENSFISCLKTKASDALTILGSQAGYIYLPDTDEGSDFMPFSNTLDFLGLNIPYWWYVSGNNIQKNQVPSLTFMQNQLKTYMDNNAKSCEDNLRLLEGFNVNFGTPQTSVKINDNYVSFDIAYPLNIEYSNENIAVPKQSFDISTQLGKLYNTAVKIMDKENNNSFVEARTLDEIFLYPEIPSTSLSFECSPKIWTKTAVQESLKNVIVSNIPFIKIKGTNYGKSQKYFEINVGNTDSSIRASVIALTNPFKFEVIPSDGELLKGQQVIGDGENEALDYIKNLFCISSYHFVYTVGYPVLIQLNDENGYMFQFPFQVLIVNNQPKEDKAGGAGYAIEPELCKFKLAKETINTLTSDEQGNVIPLNDVDISLKCISTTCEIGRVQKNSIDTTFPQCVNGFLIARKDGYYPAKYQVSTNIENQEFNLILEKYLNFTLNISVIEQDGKIRSLNGRETVVIGMTNDLKGHNLNLIYPSETNANLLSGDYSVKLSLFEKGTFNLAGQKVNQCTDVPQGGLLGVIGLTEEKCFDFSTPDLKLDQVFGGGAEFSINVEKGKSLHMYLLKTDTPKNVDELNAAYDAAKAASLSANFKGPEIK